jgi:hypothetical protein
MSAALVQLQEREEEEETIQAKPAGQLPSVSPNISSGIQALRGGGKPLSEVSRSFFEPCFGYDFSHVRIHADNRAADLARSINAKAFTLGRDVVFGGGQYTLGTNEGRRLLAHELVHVAQQGAAPPFFGVAPAVRVRAPSGALYRYMAVNYDRLAAELHDAMAGWGTDEEAVYRALQRLGRDPDAVRRLEAVYQSNYGESLDAAVRDDFSGEELELVLELLGRRSSSASARRIEGMAPTTPRGMRRAALRLRNAVAGWGTDEEAIFAVLLPFERDRALLEQLKRAYANVSDGENLEQRLESELSGSERDYAFYLLGGAPMRARLEVQIIPEAEANQLFQDLAGLSFWTEDNREAPLPFHYPPDGCYFRAQAMAERMTELGYASQKVFAITSPGSLRVQTPFGPDVSQGGPDVTWRYHVAPIVRVRIATGVVDMVMDPALESGPVPLNQWLGRMNPGTFSRMSIEDMRAWASGGGPAVRGSVISSRDVYYPSSRGVDAESAHRQLESDRPRMAVYSRRATLHEIASVIRSELAKPTPDINPIIRAIRIAPHSPVASASYPARRDLWTLFPDLRTQLAARLSAADMATVEAEVSRP